MTRGVHCGRVQAPTKAAILAIDLGTSGPKVALVSTTGEILGSEFEETPLIVLPGGGAEQDPEGWWRAITTAARRLLARELLPPSAIADYLALVGDSADGIPGIPRWGAKSAAALLSRYGDLDSIPDDAKEWDVKVRGAATLAESLRDRREEARLYRTLATLRRDVPLAEGLDELRWLGADRELLEELCSELGETALLSRIAQFRS